jgi:hypothetical protein
MNLRYRNMVISVATLRGAPQGRSTPKVKDQFQTIPRRRKMATQRALPAAEPILIPEENRRRKNSPRVTDLRNSKNPNHPPSIVR